MIIYEMGRRWQPVTDYMRKFQPPEVPSATAGRHLGFIGLLCILMDWLDPTFMHDWVYGFMCGILPSPTSFWFPGRGLGPPQGTFGVLPVQMQIASAEIYAHLYLATPSPKPNSKMRREGLLWANMTWSELAACGRPFRLIRRFCMQQPGGKLRVIDDAADGGQSALNSKTANFSGFRPSSTTSVLKPLARIRPTPTGTSRWSLRSLGPVWSRTTRTSSNSHVPKILWPSLRATHDSVGYEGMLMLSTSEKLRVERCRKHAMSLSGRWKHYATFRYGRYGEVHLFSNTSQNDTWNILAQGSKMAG